MLVERGSRTMLIEAAAIGHHNSLVVKGIAQVRQPLIETKADRFQPDISFPALHADVRC